MKHSLPLKPVNKSFVLLDCVERGIVSGLNKSYKWDLLRSPADEAQIVRLISSYIMANLEDEFALDED